MCVCIDRKSMVCVCGGGDNIYSLASQTLLLLLFLIGGVVGRKIIVWSNSHAKFVLHCPRISWTGNEKRGWAKQPQALNLCDLQ